MTAEDVEAWEKQATVAQFDRIQIDEGYLYLQCTRAYLTTYIRDTLIG
jgi:hypothetical protein